MGLTRVRARHCILQLCKGYVIIPILQIKSTVQRDQSPWPLHGTGAQGVCILAPVVIKLPCGLGWGSCLSRPGLFVEDQGMCLPSLHTGAYLGLGIIEDVGGLLAEAGHHFLDGRGRAANFLCQSRCLVPSPLLADDSGWGEGGAALEEKADAGH